MNRFVLISLVFLLLALSACSPKAAATQAPAESNQPGSEPAATGAPEAGATAASPAEAAVPAAGSVAGNFASGDSWLQAVTITTQALPGQGQTTVAVKDSGLDFNVKDKETYVYSFYKDQQKADVATEVTFQSSGMPNNGISLVCRAKEDYSAWYEARVAASGMYTIYQYDKAKKLTNEVPYIRLKAGVVPKGTVLPLAANTIKFSCKGEDLTLDINGGKFTASEKNADLGGDGLVGVGVLSYNDLPVRVRLDKFAISAP